MASSSTVSQLPGVAVEHPVVKVFAVLAVLAGAFGGIMLVLAVLAWPDRPDWTMLAGVSLGCCLHFAFLWAVLHLLSRILGRLEQGKR